MIKNVPPMGWNSWNTFAENINEELILSSADTLIASGLKDAGYEYVVIDDCWALRERSKEGKLVPDPAKFPHGMKYVADYLHARGLKLGMYSCAGLMTCASYPSSYNHEFVDAATFAEWGVDFLKYDYCFKPRSVEGKNLYRRTWIGSTGANMWRSTGDIVDTWDSIKELIQKQYTILPYGGVGCFNDMDMLVVGMHGKGHVGLKGCTEEEYRLHFAAWCLLASPLMIGCDIRKMDEATKRILTDPVLIGIQQDPRGVRPYLLKMWENDDLPVFVRALDGGDLAVGFFNLGDAPASLWVTTDDLGIPEIAGLRLVGKAAYTGEELVSKNGVLACDLAAHSCAVYRFRAVKK